MTSFSSPKQNHNTKGILMRSRSLVATSIAVAAMGIAGVAGAGVGIKITGGGSGGKKAELSCPGGMSRLAHVWDENAPIFPGDPEVDIEVVADIASDGYLVERITTGVHTGTHLDSPGHFIDGGRTIDELQAQEFVWPAYVIDVRDRIADPNQADDFQLTVDDIRVVERKQGKIPRGAMVVIQTGFDARFGDPSYFDPAPGFAGATVQWMVDERRIGGVGSDTLGPDATSDDLFDATYAILANDRVALPDIDNLDALNRNGDLIIAPAVPLRDGSGFMVEPLACHAKDR